MSTGPDRRYDLHDEIEKKDTDWKKVMREFHSGCEDETLFMVEDMAKEIVKLRRWHKRLLKFLTEDPEE